MMMGSMLASATTLFLFQAAVAADVAALFIAADPVHELAAHELRRYLHSSTASGHAACESELWTTTGSGHGAADDGVVLLTAEGWRQQLPVLIQQQPLASTEHLETLADRLRSGTDDHVLAPVETASGRVVVVLGATDRAVLMGSYSLIERLTPVRFQLHGDILPDRTGALPTLSNIFLAGHAALNTGLLLSLVTSACEACSHFTILPKGQIGGTRQSTSCCSTRWQRSR